MSNRDCKALIEGLLFISEGPLSIERLVSTLSEFDKSQILYAIEELRTDCERDLRGIVVAEVAGGYQLRTRPEHADVMRRMLRTRATKFSQSALESLAIIAYRQPVTRTEVEYLRGVDCGGVIKTLLDKKLIRILGKKDVPGRPIVYGTTREFLETFNLKNLTALPTLREIQDLAEIPVYEEQGELPLDSSLSAPFKQPLLHEEQES
jgi:segregation and condensation protein B